MGVRQEKLRINYSIQQKPAQNGKHFIEKCKRDINLGEDFSVPCRLSY
jgi:hypothetical protein